MLLNHYLSSDEKNKQNTVDFLVMMLVRTSCKEN